MSLFCVHLFVVSEWWKSADQQEAFDAPAFWENSGGGAEKYLSDDPNECPQIYSEMLDTTGYRCWINVDIVCNRGGIRRAVTSAKSH
jgi:hypothetical protein